MAANLQPAELSVNIEYVLNQVDDLQLQVMADRGSKAPPTTGRNERRKARTRASLLSAARRRFGEHGFDATTIAEIAEEADIAVGSFYNYFRTKEELLAALLEETLAGQLARMESRRSGITDPAEAISVAHRHFVRLASEEPEWARLLVRLDVPYQVAIAVLARPAMRDLRAGIRAGRFQVADPLLALRASGGALTAVMHAVLLGEVGKNADRHHAEGVLRSFGLDPAEAEEIARRPLPEPREASQEDAGR
jgi:AcrR family transcriptional regulator